MNPRSIDPRRMSRTHVLVEGALMVALAFVLSNLKIFRMPLGGSVTLLSTLPMVIFSLRHNMKWGIFTATVFGFLQLILGFDNILYMKTFLTMVVCALLDYILAYACLGFTGSIARKIKHGSVGVAIAATLTGLMRVGCSILSGIVVWGEYTPEGWSVERWSVYYNGSWGLPDMAMVVVAVVILSRIPVLALGQRSQKAAA